jgi:hypothetical protein
VPLPSGGAVSYDNVALEFNTVPALTHDEFIWNMGSVLKDLNDYLPEDVNMKFIASANFKESELQHKDAKEFGCSPDYCAWSGLANEMQLDDIDPTFRSCGAHIHVRHIPKSGHFGFLLNQHGVHRSVMAMDIMNGLASVILDNCPESIARKKLYGKAGCYRTTNGGFEYRTLSNYWIKTPNMVHLAHKLTDAALMLVATDQVEIITMECGGPHNLQSVITQGDAENAMMLWDFAVVPLLSNYTRDLFAKCFLECDDNINPMEAWKI